MVWYSCTELVQFSKMNFSKTVQDTSGYVTCTGLYISDKVTLEFREQFFLKLLSCYQMWKDKVTRKIFCNLSHQ